MHHQGYSFRLMCRPVKGHIVMLGTADQTGAKAHSLHTFSVRITLPEHNRRLSVCVALPLRSRTEESGGDRSERVERSEEERETASLIIHQ